MQLRVGVRATSSRRMHFDDLSEEFPERIRRRGEDYDRAKRVSILEHSPTLIRAVAMGTKPYAVHIEAKMPTLVLGCTCDDFLQSGPCKHLWATALLAERKRLFAAMPSCTEFALNSTGEPSPDRDFRAESTGEWSDESEDEEEETEGEEAEESEWNQERDEERDPFYRDLDSRRLERGASNAGGRFGRQGLDMTPQARSAPLNTWQDVLREAVKPVPSRSARTKAVEPPTGELIFVIELPKMVPEADLVVSLRTRIKRKKGGFAKDRAATVFLRTLSLLTDERERQALCLLQVAALEDPSAYSYQGHHNSPIFPSEARVSGAIALELLPLVASLERLYIRDATGAEPIQATLELTPSWEFSMEVQRGEANAGVFSACLKRGESVVPLSEPLILTQSGWAIFPDRVARFEARGAFGLVNSLRRSGPVRVPEGEESALLEGLFGLPQLPALKLPSDIAFEEVSVAPKPILRVGPPAARAWHGPSDRPTAELSFAYGSIVIDAADPRSVVLIANERRLVHRDRAGEDRAIAALEEVGFQRALPPGAHDFRVGYVDIAPARLPPAVRKLVSDGWRVEAEGKIYRQPGRMSMSVTSHTDWFDVNAQVSFDGVTATLPELLAALQRGQDTVVLGDGSFGVLPEEWLQKYGLLADIAAREGDSLRFGKAQLGLLDMMLAAEPEVLVDEVFAKARRELQSFDSIQRQSAPPEFQAELRPYQELGLGWLSFLRRFGFGGCLADDMGLGKTVQVLAMLCSRPHIKGKPSLIVVPKSLIWNWQREASRFAPTLRVLIHTGSTRPSSLEAMRAEIADVDVIITTYGLVRKDIGFMREVVMDYLILDEAQAIKNIDSESAKAARLLRGDHRLALSGTPIENHVGELWSLFEFLNPGMLGGARVFAGATGTRRLDADKLAVVSRVITPFMLRRTKQEVAPELPAKHEETLICEMEPEQRRLYDELRRHYQGTLLGKIARDGIGKSKIQVLEALLRLRQVACHPALVDRKHADKPSGKLDVLFARLEEVRREGHKALVFSQFTSFLGLVRERLDADQVAYEYLDGKTKNRQAHVDRFQSDPDCRLFLISLKAGGVGLNLTAADYVFILDPWWNPAVEAQAVDRAHRIGQDKRVFVYRLLCRGSVEEKVAALQADKRELAESIINADSSLIQKLDKETLELLLA